MAILQAQVDGTKHWHLNSEASETEVESPLMGLDCATTDIEKGMVAGDKDHLVAVEAGSYREACISRDSYVEEGEAADQLNCRSGLR